MARNEIDFGISFRSGTVAKCEVEVTHRSSFTSFALTLLIVISVGDLVVKPICSAALDCARELSKERTVRVVVGVDRREQTHGDAGADEDGASEQGQKQSERRM